MPPKGFRTVSRSGAGGAVASGQTLECLQSQYFPWSAPYRVWCALPGLTRWHRRQERRKREDRKSSGAGPPLPWHVSCTAAQRCPGSLLPQHSPEGSGRFQKRRPRWPQTPTAGPPFLCNQDETAHTELEHYLKPLSGNWCWHLPKSAVGWPRNKQIEIMLGQISAASFLSSLSHLGPHNSTQ